MKEKKRIEGILIKERVCKECAEKETNSLFEIAEARIVAEVTRVDAAAKARREAEEEIIRREIYEAELKARFEREVAECKAAAEKETAEAAERARVLKAKAKRLHQFDT